MKIKEKRTEKITINLTKTEKEEIIRLSKKYGLRMSPFLRFKGLSDFAITKAKGIERIKQEQKELDPLRGEIKKGFAECIKEIKEGFKEQRQFLRSIPQNELKQTQERKTERLKELGIEL